MAACLLLCLPLRELLRIKTRARQVVFDFVCAQVGRHKLLAPIPRRQLGKPPRTVGVAVRPQAPAFALCRVTFAAHLLPSPTALAIIAISSDSFAVHVQERLCFDRQAVSCLFQCSYTLLQYSTHASCQYQNRAAEAGACSRPPKERGPYTYSRGDPAPHGLSHPRQSCRYSVITLS